MIRMLLEVIFCWGILACVGLMFAYVQLLVPLWGLLAMFLIHVLCCLGVYLHYTKPD